MTFHSKDSSIPKPSRFPKKDYGIGTKYNFRADLKEAKVVENEIAEFFRLQPNVVAVHLNNDYRYDLEIELWAKRYYVEIKTDYRAKFTGNVAIEYSSRGKDSGITTTQADFYWIRIYEPDDTISNNLISVKDLRTICENNVWFRKVNGGDFKSNSLCYLFKIEALKAHCIQIDINTKEFKFPEREYIVYG